MTGIRIGNEESADGYVTKPHPNQKDKKPEFVQTFGLTTLKREMVSFRNGNCILKFVGKKQVQQRLVIADKKLVTQWKRLYELTEKGEYMLSVTDYDVRKFVKKSVGGKFMVKDFRTLFANLTAYEVMEKLLSKKKPTTKKEVKLEVRFITEEVSKKLGNTPAVCKRSYIDDMLLDFFKTKRISQ